MHILKSHKNNVLVAMSGGVDSSCAAVILKERGFKVTGVTFKLFGDQKNSIQDAKKVAEILKIDHIVLDLSCDFEKNVIKPFIDQYFNGITPNPCIICNKKIKFGKALEVAKNMGYTYFATGHYANVIYDRKVNRFLVKKSKNKKDQSYYFYMLGQEQLSHIILPLFEMEKTKVREIAKKMNLPVHNKPENQDICFTSGNYRNFIKKHKNFYNIINDLESFGNFIDEEGKYLGKHKGIYNYTIGQRKKLGITIGEKAYIKEINKNNNTIVISKGVPPERDMLFAENLNFIPYDKLDSNIEVMVKVRYNSEAVPATILPLDKDKLEVKFKNKISFIAPGQSVVFYDDDTLLGGGIISNFNN